MKNVLFFFFLATPLCMHRVSSLTPDQRLTPHPEGGFRMTDLGADMEFWLGMVLPDTSHPQTPELRGKQDTQ